MVESCWVAWVGLEMDEGLYEKFRERLKKLSIFEEVAQHKLSELT